MKIKRRLFKSIGLLFIVSAFLLYGENCFGQEAPVHTWAKGMGGTGSDAGTAIKTDISGNVYTIGYFIGTADFDPGASVSNLTSVGLNDIFISKLDANGNFVWAKSFGGTGDDSANSLFVDATGNLYIVGSFSAIVDFDPSASVLSFTAAGQTDIFISKFDTDGNLQWAKPIGGTSVDGGTSIVMGSSGNLYFTGYYSGTVDFNPDAPVFNLTAGGFNNGFVSKFDSNGNFIWAKDFSGSSYSSPSALTIDNLENVISTGNFRGSNDFDPGAGTFSMTAVGIFGNSDIFVSKLDKDGNFIWAKQMGGTGQDYSVSIVVDATGNVYTTGYFFTISDFDPGAATFSFDAGNSGFGDIFVSKLDSNGDFVWAKQMGSQGSDSDDRGFDLTLDNSGNVLITGTFNTSGDFDPGPGVFNLSTGGADGGDVFISKLDANGNFIWAARVGGSVSNGQDWGNAITINQLGSIYVTGSFSTTADFDVNACTFNLTVAGSRDIFVHKLDIGTSLIPTFSSFAPTFGPVGTTVTLTGTNFSTTLANNGVLFNGTPAIVSASSPTTITTAVPTGATTGKINITVNCTTVTRVQDFIVTSSTLPTITSFTPTSGFVGATVTITGTNFSTTPANNTVRFNGTVAIVTASTATSINATVPIGATTGKISGTVAGNTAISTTDFIVTDNFVTRWNLATAGSGAAQLTFGTATSGTVNYTWQQLPSGTSGTGSWSGATLTITGLPTGATIRLQITPTNFQRINLNNGADRNRLTQVEQWGTTVWSSMQNAFRGCANLQVTATDLPDLSGLSDLSGMFSMCNTLNSPNNIGSWNTSVVTNMSALFSLASAFNQNISSWNTGAVTNMSSLFADAAAFNQDIGAWNTAAVTNMAGMFTGALVFNRNIGAWNTATVTNMNSMFFSAYVFNQNIGGWNTAAVTNMSGMFGYAYAFNQNIGTWNTSAVTNMSSMFIDAFNFNQNIGTWNTSAVTNMRSMFIDAYDFNQNIGTWNTSAVTDMERMFDFATAFNQNIGAWNTAAVTTMRGMFADASAFNQNLETWTLNPAVNLSNMLNNTGMNCNNYSATLIGWSANPSTPNSRTLGATGRQYGTNAVAARTNLTSTKGWTITGDTPSGSVCVLVTPINFTPSSGPVGTMVTITGAGFSSTPANNTVMFNGTTAVVTASATASITVPVPAGATTGAITVTVAGNTAISSTNFTVTPSPIITITTQPFDFTTCAGQTANFTTAATGTTNILYQWQFSTSLTGTYSDITNGSEYSNVTTASLSVNTTGNFGAGFYRCKIDGDLAITVFSNAAELTVNATPVAPTVTSASSCTAGVLTLAAAGGVNGQYRWYTVATGGTAFPGEVNNSYTTPVLSSTQIYYVAIDDGTCESIRTAGVATIGAITPTTTSSSSCGDGIVILSASGGTNGQYRWYNVSTGGTPISGETNDTYTTPLLSTTTTYYVSVDIGFCEGARTPVIANILSVPSNPSGISSSNCGSGSVVLSASGGINGQYRWYNVATGGTALVGEVNDSYPTPVIGATTTYYVSINNGTCESTRTSVAALINTVPAAPIMISASSCSAASVLLTASGGTGGNYRWYTLATGGIAIAGETNSSYTTPVLSASATYYVSITDGATCESVRSPVMAIINTPLAAPITTGAAGCVSSAVTLTATGGTAGQYRWYNTAIGGTSIAGETNSSFTTPALSASTTYYVSIHDGTCESTRTSALANITTCSTNLPPVIQTTSITIEINGEVTLRLLSLISDPDNNIDLTKLTIVSQPISGAFASIDANQNLIIDYSTTSYTGTDELTIEVCDLAGSCVQQKITIQVEGDIIAYNGMSPNGDAQNSIFEIKNIDILEETKNNRVSIYNRWGSKVFEVENYNNTTRVFTGLNDNGNELPSGTYFYKIEFSSGRKTDSGYLSLKR